MQIARTFPPSELPMRYVFRYAVMRKDCSGFNTCASVRMHLWRKACCYSIRGHRNGVSATAMLASSAWPNVASNRSASNNKPMPASPDLSPRTVRESQSEMIQLVLPNDANPLGNLLGGTLMHWIDLAAALAAHRHARAYVVTASIDHLDFLVPVHVGDLVILRSSVNRAFKTSMEIGVQVLVENYIASTRSPVSSAYLTFVAVDRTGHRLPVPPVVPESEDEKRRYEDAIRRREIREAERRRKTGRTA